MVRVLTKSNALMQQRTSVRVTYGSQKSKAPSVSCSVFQRADTPKKRHLPAEDRGDGRSDDDGDGDGDDTVNSTEDTQAMHSAKKRLVQTSLFLGSQLRAVKRSPETNLESGTKKPLQIMFPELGLPNKTQTSAGKLGVGDNWTVPKRKASQILNHHGRASSLAAAHGDTPCKREQTFLDFGQKPLGLELCQICGMAYQRGKEEDEDLHTRFHRLWQQKQARLLSWDVESMTAENKSQIEFVPYRKNCDNKSKARIDKQQSESMAAIIFVYPQVCSKREVVRALAIINVANEHLGAVKLSCRDLEHSQRKILLYISPDGRVEGCILAEAIQSARRIVVEEEAQLMDSAVRLLEDEEPATCGISRIWVLSTARRCGIASQMIDALCKRFAYGCEISRDMLAFTQPTSEGRALAEAMAINVESTNQFIEILQESASKLVDIGRFSEVAAQCRITATPTIQFFRNGRMLSEVRGADQKKIVEAIESGLAEGNGEPKSAHGVIGHSDVTSMVVKKESDCLNQNDDHPLENVFTEGDSVLESDVDEQMIIHVSFRQPIKLHSIMLKAPLDKAPKNIRLFANNTTIGFDDVDGIEATQSIEMSESMYKNGGVVNLRYVRFQNICSLSIFVEDNLDGDDVTAISQLAFIGTAVDIANMSEIRQDEH
ncbi:hypothetical protein H4217_003449 [Coemansia sp. RSA 1939]|nr:hypothetical protein H4217_003449 [Coemansia sp. RSA 1939]